MVIDYFNCPGKLPSPEMVFLIGEPGLKSSCYCNRPVSVLSF